MSELPSHASVVVIGGGVMGCSTLYHLAKEGVGDAILLERNKLTSGTTWHSAAQVRALRSSRNLTEMIRYSISLYASLQEETGQSVGWINKGSLSIATNPERLTYIRRQEALARAFGLGADFLTADQAGEIWPLARMDDVLGAVFAPEDGRVSPADLCAGLVKGAKSRGAKIFEETGVTGILTKDGKITGVETDKGAVSCDAVALCTGLWSREAAAMAGVEAPIWPCEHFYLLTKPVDGITGNLPTLGDHDGHLYIRDDSGGLLVGCFEPMGKPIDPDRLGPEFAFQLLPEDWDHFEPMMLNALHRLPVLETAEVKMLLNGPESFTPDGAFMLGESAETDGFFLGCGMNSVGVASGGGAGMALAHNIVHGRTPWDLPEVDPKRFPSVVNSVAALTERIPEILGTHYEIHFPGRGHATARHLRATPMHERFVAEKARFAQVHGWERPQYFGCEGEPELTHGKPAWFDQVGKEVRQATEAAAIFDQSTFGKIEVEGPDAETFLNRVCANRMDRPSGRVLYTAILNDRGTFESDITLQRLSDEHYRLFVGSTAVRRDMAWLRRSRGDGERVTVMERTEDFAIVGLMGPGARAIAAEVGAEDMLALDYFRHAETEIAGVPCRAARLSYVGEPGWEITCPADRAVELYDAFHAAGARPAGIFAQTAMRIEKRFLSFGHDLDGDVSPLEAGLDFAVGWDKDFVGRDALLRRREAGLSVRTVSLELDDSEAVPLGNEPVLLEGVIIGTTTSAAFGYRVGRPVALAYLRSDALPEPEGARVEIDIARARFQATATMAPVFDPTGARMRG